MRCGSPLNEAQSSTVAWEASHREEEDNAGEADQSFTSLDRDSIVGPYQASQIEGKRFLIGSPVMNIFRVGAESNDGDCDEIEPPRTEKACRSRLEINRRIENSLGVIQQQQRFTPKFRRLRSVRAA